MGVKALINSYEALMANTEQAGFLPASTPAQSRPCNRPPEHHHPHRFRRHPLLTNDVGRLHDWQGGDDTLAMDTLSRQDPTDDPAMTFDDCHASSTTPQGPVTTGDLPTELNTLTLATESDTPSLNNAFPTQPHGFTDHDPLPANTVFSRHAAPLYLPKLDQTLERLPPISFQSSGIAETGVFPPMHLLDLSKCTLDDLESNVKAASWYDRKNLLASAVNYVLGFTVCQLEPSNH
jgi:hypothetical protein